MIDTNLAYENNQKIANAIMKLLIKDRAIIYIAAIVFICSRMETMPTPFKLSGKNG
jgi:Tfp pilus assembly protein PilZ